MNRFIQFDW